MTQKDHVLAAAIARIGEARYAVDIKVGEHAIVADEPESLGGRNAGPPPFGLLLSALGACTAATLKMYAEHKQWPLVSLRVELSYLRTRAGDRIERRLYPIGPLDDAQRAKLADVAERTPVTLVVKGGVMVHTELGKETQS